jgi:hypothetical protein
MHGGAPGSGAPIGNTNALRHGHYTAAAIARRRQLSELIRTARAALANIEERSVGLLGVQSWPSLVRVRHRGDCRNLPSLNLI